MALIKCTRCGHMISEKALRCPKCGQVVGEVKTPAIVEKDNIKNGFKKYLPYIFGAVVILGISGYFLCNNSSNDSLNEANSTDAVALDSISTDDVSESLNPKEEITKRLEEIFDDVMKGTVHEYDERFFSSDFKRIYKEVDEIDQRLAQEGYLGFWDFGFWDMAQDDVTIDITVDDVYNIKGDEAMAKVTFNFIADGQTETKNEEIRVILENGKWVLDDLHGYKKQMKEYLGK